MPGKSRELGNPVPGKCYHLEGDCCLWNKEIQLEKFALLDGNFAIMDGNFAIMDGNFAIMEGNFDSVPGKVHIFSNRAHRTIEIILFYFLNFGSGMSYLMKDINVVQKISSEKAPCPAH